MSRLRFSTYLVLNLVLIICFPANADENSTKLNNISQEAKHKPKVLIIKGINVATQTLLAGVTNWKLINQDTNEVISFTGENSSSHINIGKHEKDIEPGKWLVSGISGEYTGLSTVDISGEKDQLVEVSMLHKVIKVKLNAPKEAITGTIISITWNAPDTIDGKINLQKISDKPLYYAPPNLYTKNQKEPKAEVRLPSDPGEYYLRFYNTRDIKKAITEHHITLKAAKITFNAPKEAVAGTEIDISWSAPITSSAQINLKYAESEPRYNARYSLHTKGKTKGKLLLPSGAGDYVLRWFNSYDRKPVLEHLITLVDQKITINAPDIAEPGTNLKISWEAPDRSQAKLILAKLGGGLKKKPSNYIYTKGKTNGILKLPHEVGSYLLRWQNESDQRVIIEHSIELAVKVLQLTAPDEKSFDIIE